MKNKNFTLIAIFLSYILVSCSGEETKQTIKDSAVGGVYAEYLFCDFGPDMSEESFQGLLKDWNNILDDSAYRGCHGPPPSVRVRGLGVNYAVELFRHCLHSLQSDLLPSSSTNSPPERGGPQGPRHLAVCLSIARPVGLPYAVRNSVSGRKEGRNVREGGRSCISAFFSHLWREAHRWRCPAAL